METTVLWWNEVDLYLKTFQQAVLGGQCNSNANNVNLCQGVVVQSRFSVSVKIIHGTNRT